MGRSYSLLLPLMWHGRFHEQKLLVLRRCNMGLFSLLFGGNASSLKARSRCRVVAIRNINGERITTIRRGTRELWQEKGFQLKDGILCGYYRACGRVFKGVIKDPFSDPELYIHDPPRK